CGGAIGMSVLRVHTSEPELINGLPIIFDEEDARTNPRDPDGYMLSPLGVIKWLLSTDIKDFKTAERRKQAERMQERAWAAWAAESIRAVPRSFDEVIAAEFRVDRLRAAMDSAAAGVPGVLDRALQALMESEAVS